jgi:hypothetical protein
MQGARDLIASERGVFCIALLVAASVLAVAKVITGADWLTFAKWLAITLVTSKTATGVIETLSNKAAVP